MKRLFWERLAWLWILCIPLAVAGGIGYGGQAYNPQSVAITGGTIGGTSVAGVAAAGAASPYNPASVAITGGTISASTINATTSQSLNGNLIMSATAPAINAGFGTNPSIVASNGTAAFVVNVGTGGTAVFGTVYLPAAPHMWSCAVTVDQLEANSANYPRATITSITNLVGINNIVTSTGAQTPWPSGDTFTVNCIPY